MNNALNIAVVGSGISGLSSAWLLSRNHRVTLFEKDSRLGGHSNTVDIMTSAGTIAVDTGFIVFNKHCYPNLVALFEHLSVPYTSTTMSFGVSLDKGRLEYSGSDSISSLFAQRKNLFSLRFWRMVLDILRFYRKSEHWLEQLPNDMTLGELLKKEGFSKGFSEDHLLPMSAAIWSTPADQMLQYPAKTFLRFCINHGLVQVKNRPQWQSVIGGAREYVRKISGSLNDVKLNCGVKSVKRSADKVFITDDNGDTHSFDHVVFASHADETLAMLEDPSKEEQQLLGSFQYEENRAILHRDERLMPKLGEVWSSWNYLSGSQDQQQKVSVSYWMNALQHLPCHESIIVTLNPLREPRPHLTYQEFNYHHPVFDRKALQAQQKLWSLQGQQRSWYCGSYFGYGFHEDGIQSGLAVAETLGGERRPWSVENESGRIILETNPGVDSAA
jgi:predicted NAD/FAD-binding protein